MAIAVFERKPTLPGESKRNRVSLGSICEPIQAYPLEGFPPSLAGPILRGRSVLLRAGARRITYAARRTQDGAVGVAQRYGAAYSSAGGGA
jgi:hypothetical protein